MKSSYAATLQFRRIWLLTAVAIVSAALSIYIVSRVTWKLSRQLETHLVLQSEFNLLEGHCLDLVQESNRDLFEVLNDPRTPRPIPIWMKSHGEDDIDLTSVQSSEKSSLLGELRKVREALAGNYRQASDWAAAWVEHEQRYLAQKRKVQLELQELVACINEQLSQAESELQMTSLHRIDLQQHDGKCDVHSIVEWGRFQFELSELGLSIAKIQNFEDPNRFEDYKANHLEPILDRLQHSISRIEDKGLEGRLMRHFQDLELVITGQGPLGKSKIREGDSLLDCISERFHLQSENRRIDFDAVETSNTVHEMVAEFRTQASLIQRDRQISVVQLVRHSWWLVWGVALSGLTLLVLLSIGLPRMIKKQFLLLQQAFDDCLRHEKRLGEQKERFIHATTNANLGIWELQVADREFWMSEQGLAMIGAHSVDGKFDMNTWVSLIHSDDRAQVLNSLELVMAGENAEWRGEYRMLHPDGTTRWLRSIGKTTERNAVGRPALIAGIQIEETDRHAMEQQLAHASRLESLGQLAAGVAHEINTPTQFVFHQLTFLGEAFADLKTYIDRVHQVSTMRAEELKKAADEADLDYLMREVPRATEQSIEGLQRIARIVRSLKECAHPGVEKSHVEICSIIRGSIDVTRCEWKQVGELELNSDAEEIWLDAVGGELGQLFVNLIINSVHAIQERQIEGLVVGKIRIQVRELNDEVEVVIDDNGCGMTEGTQRKIFDPFFTTKPVGKGTGQGLAIAHRIVRNHQGVIQVQTKIGEGARFTIRFAKSTKVLPNQLATVGSGLWQ